MFQNCFSDFFSEKKIRAVTRKLSAIAHPLGVGRILITYSFSNFCSDHNSSTKSNWKMYWHIYNKLHDHSMLSGHSYRAHKRENDVDTERELGKHLSGRMHFVEVVHLDEVGMQPRGQVVDGHGALAAGGDVDALDAQLQACQHAHEGVVVLADQERRVIVADGLQEGVVRLGHLVVQQHLQHGAIRHV